VLKKKVHTRARPRSDIALTTKATMTALGRWGDAMPRYFFHMHGSGARDTLGQELPDDAAARQEAVTVARDLSRNRNVGTDEILIVSNDKGEIIHKEPLVPR
jgi:hypothetical protein